MKWNVAADFPCRYITNANSQGAGNILEFLTHKYSYPIGGGICVQFCHVYSILLFFGDCTWDTSHTFFSRWSTSQIRWKIYHCVRSQLLHLTNVVVCLLCFQKIHKNPQKTPPNYYLPPQLSTLYNYHLRITKLVITIELWQLKWWYRVIHYKVDETKLILCLFHAI